MQYVIVVDIPKVETKFKSYFDHEVCCLDNENFIDFLKLPTSLRTSVLIVKHFGSERPFSKWTIKFEMGETSAGLFYNQL